MCIPLAWGLEGTWKAVIRRDVSDACTDKRRRRTLVIPIVLLLSLCVLFPLQSIKLNGGCVCGRQINQYYFVVKESNAYARALPASPIPPKLAFWGAEMVHFVLH